MNFFNLISVSTNPLPSIKNLSIESYKAMVSPYFICYDYCYDLIDLELSLNWHTRLFITDVAYFLLFFKKLVIILITFFLFYPAQYCAWKLWDHIWFPQKFWLFHDRIFANQDNLTEEVIYKIAKDELGYNKAKIEKVLKANKNLLTKIKKEAEAGGLRGTPSFFLNKISFPGFVDLLKIKLSFLAAKKRRIARTKAKSGKN